MDYKRFGSKVVIRLDSGDEIVTSITEEEKKCTPGNSKV